MEYRHLGRTGLKVSTICLGTMQFGWTADQKTANAIMNKSVDLGCNFFDTADIYSTWAEGNDGGVSETMIGEWLQSSSLHRDQLVLATKVRGQMGQGPNDQGLSRHHIMTEVENSLRRLQTDYIDLYQMHWFDAETPLDETLRVLDDLVSSGKVRYIGVSNFPAWMLTKSLWVSDVRHFVRFESVQPKYSLVFRAQFERELMPLCADQGIGVIPYSPLAAGFLTGKYRRDTELPKSKRAGGIKDLYMNEKGFAALDKCEEIGNEHKATIAQVAIAWMLANSVVSSAIIGANTIEQLTDTMQGANVKLTVEEKAALDEITAWD